jgi:uncharacterized protein (TIGR03083 family)
MECAEYQSRISEEAGLLRAAEVAAGADTAIPTCPGWTALRLVQHLCGVFDMVVSLVRSGDPHTPPGRWGVRSADPHTPQARGEVAAAEFDAALAGFDDRLATMLNLLASTDPAAPVWNFSPIAPRTAAFWSRRQAHEITVHRLDAQAAAGIETPVAPDLAADGIDEVLTWWIQRNSGVWANSQPSGTVLYHAADAGRAWTVRLVPGQFPQTTPEAVTEPDGSVVGLADAVYRAAWGRPSRAITTGDTTLIEATRAG